MKFYGCILPSGNAGEFSKLDDELIKRGIAFGVANMPNGGRIYKIPEDQLHKLPQDEQGPYLGDDDSGHTIYPIDGELVKTWVFTSNSI